MYQIAGRSWETAKPDNQVKYCEEPFRFADQQLVFNLQFSRFRQDQRFVVSVTEHAYDPQVIRRGKPH